MKGFIDERGNDRPACVKCKYRNRPSNFVLCYNCIPLIDIALHKANFETEFVNFVEGDPAEESENKARCYNTAINDICRGIDAMPAADVIEVKHGRWITDNNKQTKCSICGRPIPIRKVRHNGEVIWEDNSPVNYCPCCGAKMDLEEGEEA